MRGVRSAGVPVGIGRSKKELEGAYVKNEKEISESERSDEEKTEPQDAGSGESEFKLTVRKLEMPVRPRGVLAE